MKYLIAIAFVICATGAQAKGGHMPKLPKMGVPHAHKAHRGHKEHAPKALKAKASKGAMGMFDDIGDSLKSGPEPMFAAR